MLQSFKDDGMSVADKVKTINRYARKAQSEVSQLATERRKKVREELLDVGRQIEEVGDLIDQYGDVEEGNDVIGVEDGEEDTIADEQTVGDDMEDEQQEEDDEQAEEPDEWDDLDE